MYEKQVWDFWADAAAAASVVVCPAFFSSVVSRYPFENAIIYDLVWKKKQPAAASAMQIYSCRANILQNGYTLLSITHFSMTMNYILGLCYAICSRAGVRALNILKASICSIKKRMHAKNKMHRTAMVASQRYNNCIVLSQCIFGVILWQGER